MRKTILVFFLAVLLSGCSSQVPSTNTTSVVGFEETPQAASPIHSTTTAVLSNTPISATQTRQAQPQPSPSYTPTPILLPTMSSTPLVLFSTPMDWSGEGGSISFVPEPEDQSIETPIDLQQVVTVTPSKPEQCPKQDSSLLLDLQEVLDNPLPFVDIEMIVLDFLNSGGLPQSVVEAFFSETENSDDYYLNQDLTGDGVSEFAITYDGYLDIFSCKSGKYVTILKIQNAISGYPIRVDPVRDLNLNGVPEIILSTTTCNAPCTEVRVFEWSGNQFTSLLRTEFYGYLFDYAQIYNGIISTEDLDGNGFIEIIIQGGIPTQMAALANGFPFRQETQIYSWNDMVFEQISHEYSPPQYRFQTVQDGDKASLAGNYDEAVEYYQEAIFSDKLDWWSVERREYLLETEYSYSSSEESTSTPPQPNPNEYFNLAGYARYRIMLLHIIRGWLPEAEIVYNTLQEKFPHGEPGNAFAELAEEFWLEYQTSKNIELACAKSIEYTRDHPAEILTYLGSSEFGYYGDQSLRYRPEDICPFK